MKTVYVRKGICLYCDKPSTHEITQYREKNWCGLGGEEEVDIFGICDTCKKKYE